METNKVYSKVEDFLMDDDFIKYVLDMSPELAFRWESLLRRQSELFGIYEEAKAVLLAPADVGISMTQAENEDLKRRIFTTLEI